MELQLGQQLEEFVPIHCGHRFGLGADQIAYFCRDLHRSSVVRTLDDSQNVVGAQKAIDRKDLTALGCDDLLRFAEPLRATTFDRPGVLEQAHILGNRILL